MEEIKRGVTKYARSNLKLVFLSALHHINVKKKFLRHINEKITLSKLITQACVHEFISSLSSLSYFWWRKTCVCVCAIVNRKYHTAFYMLHHLLTEYVQIFIYVMQIAIENLTSIWKCAFFFNFSIDWERIYCVMYLHTRYSF